MKTDLKLSLVNGICGHYQVNRYFHALLSLNKIRYITEGSLTLQVLLAGKPYCRLGTCFFKLDTF